MTICVQISPLLGLGTLNRIICLLAEMLTLNIIYFFILYF